MKENSIEIIGMIYRSVEYLDSMVMELNNCYSKVPGWDVSFRVLANDANEKVLNHLSQLEIPYSIYTDPKPDDYYLNRVYRCWNYGAVSSSASNICFVNSDMMFSEGWLANLLKYHNGKNIPCSRLVESGKMRSGRNAIGNKNFGRRPKDFDYTSWTKFVQDNKTDSTKSGGLFMPCVFNRSLFLDSGMYPEGNIYSDGEPGSLAGKVVMSGDAHYFKLLKRKYGMKHITVYDSLVYHIQEGEMDE